MKMTTATFLEINFRKDSPFLLVFTAKIIYSTIAGFIVGYFDPSVFDIHLDVIRLLYKIIVA